MCDQLYICAGAAEADRGRAPRLLPAAGVHPAVQVLHGSVSSPPPAQPGASAAQPQRGQEVRITTAQTRRILTVRMWQRELKPCWCCCCRSTMKQLFKAAECGIQTNNIGSPYPCSSAMLWVVILSLYFILSDKVTFVICGRINDSDSVLSQTTC